MRRLLLVVMVAGCAHSTSSGPAWPKDRAGGGDGGESIAPREAATSVAVAMEADDDKPTEKAVDKPAAAAATPASEASAPATNAAAPSEEPITTEEIVIEVGPDD